MALEQSLPVVGMVACTKLSLFARFLRLRSFPVIDVAGAPCDVLVACHDHLSLTSVHDWGLRVDGPKVIVGGGPPPGWGNAHRLEVPLLPLQLEQFIGSVLGGTGPAQGTERRTFEVILVEDDATTRTAVGAALAKWDLKVHACGGFGDVATLIHHSRPDLILLDLNLPGVSGEILAGFIRERGIPIALLSSAPAEELEAARTRVGAVTAFSKSESLRTIAHSIRDLLEHAA